ncbi:MAG: radical SAM protein [Dehalococcoidales bacterium]|nr:radical SAM protein [Dehalococcoidales bacterium]
MTSVLLIYPYFHPSRDWSIFRFPPLGLGYIASALIRAGYEVDILDCTFLKKEETFYKALRTAADVVGIYAMVSMQGNAREFARHLRKRCRLLIAGGPLPTCDPESFLDAFDIVVTGEGERTIVQVLEADKIGCDLETIPGIVFRKGKIGVAGNPEGKIVHTPPRPLEPDLDGIPLPTRELLPNQKYIEFWKKKGVPATTSVMTTRGCPFSCDFCSNAVFGNSYRERSVVNVIDEVEHALSLGYQRIHFADDVFTLKKDRVVRFCEEIMGRNLHFAWECLGRVDSIDASLAGKMKKAGCDRIFFGIESGNDAVLKMMNKNITVEKARRAVYAAHEAGIKTGAFLMLGYPGETDETILNSIRFAGSLPLDYLSYTVPYPLPGTALYGRTKDKVTKEWENPGGLLTDHSLIFKTDFSETKLKFALLKGQSQFILRKKLGNVVSPLLKPCEALSDLVFKLLK